MGYAAPNAVVGSNGSADATVVLTCEVNTFPTIEMRLLNRSFGTAGNTDRVKAPLPYCGDMT